MTRTVLFVCTGNYYRSRFAELLFNSLASRSGLDWMALSRGITADFGVQNIGPISPFALRGLEARGIPVKPGIRFPMQLKERDLAEADLVVALNEEEHRYYLETRYPGLRARVEYWHIPDLDVAPADPALAELERKVHSLVRRLKRSPM